MLFDLRGRGRRRTVQVIYLSLAVLMGGGLVLFGIGGGTNGGLFDAIGGSGGSSTSTDKVFQDRLAAYERQLQANPQNTAALIGMTKLRFGNASTGENFNQTQGAYTDKGLAQLRAASAAWQRYLATNPDKPDPSTANLMVQAYGPAGLKQYDKAVTAMEAVIDSRKETANLYAQLAILAAGAKQDRKADLAEQKALDLTPAKDRKQLKSEIDLQKSQLTVQQPTQSQSG
jgi:tetratricopeptide (TPR) repeat protein